MTSRRRTPNEAISWMAPVDESLTISSASNLQRRFHGNVTCSSTHFFAEGYPWKAGRKATPLIYKLCIGHNFSKMLGLINPVVSLTWWNHHYFIVDTNECHCKVDLIVCNKHIFEVTWTKKSGVFRSKHQPPSHDLTCPNLVLTWKMLHLHHYVQNSVSIVTTIYLQFDIAPL